MEAQQAVKPKSILVIGAGELGMPVLRNLARKAKDHDGTTVSVLLRAASVKSTAPLKMRDVSEIRNLGIEIVTGDILAASISELAEIFAPFETVIGCAGFSAVAVRRTFSTLRSTCETFCAVRPGQTGS